MLSLTLLSNDELWPGKKQTKKNPTQFWSQSVGGAVLICAAAETGIMCQPALLGRKRQLLPAVTVCINTHYAWILIHTYTHFTTLSQCWLKALPTITQSQTIYRPSSPCANWQHRCVCVREREREKVLISHTPAPFEATLMNKKFTKVYNLISAY